MPPCLPYRIPIRRLHSALSGLTALFFLCLCSAQPVQAQYEEIPMPPAIEELSFDTLESGLAYKVLEAGAGEPIEQKDKVWVHYAGWLPDGTLFDASYGQDARPFRFKVGKGQVIPGWEEGVQQLKPGGKAILVIPPELGYGSEGYPPTIPPNTNLVFIVEVVEVK